jgi:phosphoribosylanthranilate isomerase (EC 5.3.1.24)
MMSPFLVKICGLSTPESLEWALAAGADLVGFVHFPRSPRHLSVKAAAELARRVDGRAKTVVLTVNADDALLDHLVATIGPDFVQLHGQESPERVADVRRRVGLPVIKALGIGTTEDVAAARPFAGVADLLLYDAKPPKDASRPGGLGVTFDWSLLESAPSPSCFPVALILPTLAKRCGGCAPLASTCRRASSMRRAKRMRRASAPS